MSDESSARAISGTPLKPAIPFAESLLSRVQGFNCGDKTYEEEVARWIQAARGGGGALDDMANSPTTVWLYESEAGELVGFGSLGLTQWRWSPIWIIPFYGVQAQFQGQPPGPKEDRYARRIFEDLLAKAVAGPTERQLLGLCVHPENERAIRVYRAYGFVEYGQNKEGYLRMIVNLRP
jgi:ribosomal protein S18 acetylase RimI-like enzyme